MAEGIYLLCALTSLACAVLLTQGYRRTRTPLLRWSSWAFALLAANNILLFIDLAILHDSIDLSAPRTALGCLAGGFLLYGLTQETLRGGV